MRRYGRWRYRSGGQRSRARHSNYHSSESKLPALVIIALVGLMFDATFWVSVVVLTMLGLVGLLVAWIAFSQRRGKVARARLQGGYGGRSNNLRSDEPLRESTPISGREVRSEKAIVQPVEPCVRQQASTTQRRQRMTYDKRFALIDSQGRRRYAQILNGTYQIGKASDETPTDLTSFARAVLLHGKDGRFRCQTGEKQGILGYGKRECRAYELDHAIAAQVGVPAKGSL